MDCRELQAYVKRSRLEDIGDDKFPGLEAHLLECRACNRVFRDRVNKSILSGILAARDAKAAKQPPPEELRGESEDDCPVTDVPNIAEGIPAGLLLILDEAHDSTSKSAGGYSKEVADGCRPTGSMAMGRSAETIGQDTEPAVTDEDDFAEFFMAHEMTPLVQQEIARAWRQGVESIVASDAEQPAGTGNVTELASRIMSSEGRHDDVFVHETAIQEGFKQAMSLADQHEAADGAVHAGPSQEEYLCVQLAIANPDWLAAQADEDPVRIEQVGVDILEAVHVNLAEPFKVCSVPELEQVIDRWSVPFLTSACCVPKSAVA